MNFRVFRCIRNIAGNVDRVFATVGNTRFACENIV